MLSLSRLLRIARATGHGACGWLAYRLGWAGTARRQFERVLLLRGADFRAYVHLGRIAFDHGDYAGWRREFEHARRTDPIRFARLRHPIELFEPRLAGTQFERSGALDGFQAADSRATWRALHPFQDPRDLHPDSFGATDQRLDHHLGFGTANGIIHGQSPDDGRTPDGYGRGTDLPLAPGYDPLAASQQLGDEEAHEVDDIDANPDLADEATRLDPLGLGANDSGLTDDALHAIDPLNRPFTGHPSWNTPDASLSRDDFSSPSERRRFQLRRPIDSQDIARCDLNDLARRLCD